MRKTSHDGGDSTSITSGAENEIKKSALKSKKSSLKRKAPMFSNDSDDTVVEPLLQKDKQKMETTPSAKYLTKGKTDSLQNKEIDNKTKTSTTTGFCGTTESLLSLKDSEVTKTTCSGPIHNYMNINVFNTHDNLKSNVETKTQMLVEIDGNKQSGYNPGPLIFTTAKIHTDGKSKNMEPVQVTPVPILSTIEVSVSKGGNLTTSEKKISNGSSVISSVYIPTPLNNDKGIVNNSKAAMSPCTSKDAFSKVVTTSPNKLLSNSTSAQSSPMGNNLPTTTSKSITIEKKATLTGNQKEKEKIVQPQSKTLNLENIKSVVTTTAASEKINSVDSTKLIKTSQSNDQTDKTRIKSSTGSSGDCSVKTESSYHPKVVESVSLKDSNKVADISANNAQSLNKKSTTTTLTLTTTAASISTAKTPVATKMITSNIVTTSDVTSKPLTTPMSYTPVTISTTVPLSNVSKTDVVTFITTGSTVISKTSGATAAKATMQPVSSVSKADLVKSPSISISSATKTTPSSPYIKTSAVTVTTSPSSITSTTISQNLPNQTAVSKAPCVIAPIKSPSVSSVSSKNSKSSSTTSKVPPNTKSTTLASSMAAATVVTSSTPTARESSVVSGNKTPHAVVPITTDHEKTKKQLMNTTSTKASNITPAATTSTVISANASSVTIKSPNNNSLQMAPTTKSMTSVAKTEPSETTLSKSSTATTAPSTSIASTSKIKSPQGTSSTSKVTTSTSSKKPAVKIQADSTKSSPVDYIKSQPASTPMASNKQTDGKTVLAKKTLVTATSKTPTVTATSKTPTVTASATTSTGSAGSSTSPSTTKPPASNITQVSTTKPLGISGTSASSSTTISRPSESVKKDIIKPKSNENDKDDKLSKI